MERGQSAGDLGPNGRNISDGTTFGPGVERDALDDIFDQAESVGGSAGDAVFGWEVTELAHPNDVGMSESDEQCIFASEVSSEVFRGLSLYLQDDFLVTEPGISGLVDQSAAAFPELRP
jgi:hypothetical protein